MRCLARLIGYYVCLSAAHSEIALFCILPDETSVALHCVKENYACKTSFVEEGYAQPPRLSDRDPGTPKDTPSEFASVTSNMLPRR